MKVLVADDDPVSRRLLQSYLQKWGYEVAVAVNGAEAWQLFEQEEFPLVISDWMMPDPDGMELCRLVRGPLNRQGYIYFILMTSTPEREKFVEAIKDPDHERHDELLEWIGGAFSPDKFHAGLASSRMRRGLPDWRED